MTKHQCLNHFHILALVGNLDSDACGKKKNNNKIKNISNFRQIFERIDINTSGKQFLLLKSYLHFVFWDGKKFLN